MFRIACALALVPIAVACGDGKKTPDNTEAKPADPVKSTAPAKAAPAVEWKCDTYLSSAEVSEACGKTVTLVTAPNGSDSRPCRLSNKSGDGRAQGFFQFTATKVFGSPRDFTFEAASFDDSTHHRKKLRAGVIKGSYQLELKSEASDKAPPACTQEQLLTLTKKVAERFPEVGKPPKLRKSNPICDKALTAESIKSICGEKVRLRPTSFEGIKMNPCNRGGGGLLFLVSEHRSAAIAKQAEKVASGEETTVALASGNFLIEVKSKDGACASRKKLTSLANKAAATFK